ncbi:MAG: VanZ family protein [Thermoleophilia bacterium]
MLAWAGLIFYFSAQSSLSTGWGVWDYVLRKGAHMTEFGILALLLWRAIRQHLDAGRLAMTLAAAAALLYACSDEYHQSFVNGRTASVRDVGFDLAGILLAMAFSAAVYRYLNGSDSGFGGRS